MLPFVCLLRGLPRKYWREFCSYRFFKSSVIKTKQETLSHCDIFRQSGEEMIDRTQTKLFRKIIDKKNVDRDLVGRFEASSSLLDYSLGNFLIYRPYKTVVHLRKQCNAAEEFQKNKRLNIDELTKSVAIFLILVLSCKNYSFHKKQEIAIHRPLYR